MNLRRLRCFVAAADDSNFGRAADRLNIAHSAFSRQIAHLEDELGVLLFVRQGRRVVLSEAGAIYAARIRPILAALHEAANEVRLLKSDDDAAIVFGVQEHIGGHGEVVRALRAIRLGPFEFDVRPLGSFDMVVALGEGRIDLGLAYGEPRLLATVAHCPVGRDRYRIAMSADHPLAAKPQLIIDDLRGAPFVHIDTGINQGLQDDLMARLSALGFEPVIVQRVPRVSGLVSLLAANIGIAFMPVMIGTPAGIVTREVAGLDIPIPVNLIWRPAEHREAVLRAIELCADRLRGALSDPV